MGILCAVIFFIFFYFFFCLVFFLLETAAAAAVGSQDRGRASTRSHMLRTDDVGCYGRVTVEVTHSHVGARGEDRNVQAFKPPSMPARDVV